MVKSTTAERRLLYALGPGDVVTNYRRWRTGDEGLGETSLTFSGQFFELCRRRGYRGYAISSFPKAEIESDTSIVAENRPKRFIGRGIRFHISQLLYGISIIVTAIRWRADYVFVDSGTTHWAILAALRLVNIPVSAVLHNAPWPTGHKPKEFPRRVILRSDGWFWRHAASAVISVSPECERQVIELAGVFPGKAIQCRAQFRISDFAAIDPPPPIDVRPFRIVFAGRVERDKGVLDLVEIARIVEASYPGQTQFDVCGSGTALDELRELVDATGTGHLIHTYGRLNRTELLKVYARSHAFIVPTRSTFCEGMPMVCAEATLCGRPVIAPPVTNAMDVLGGALLLADTDDPRSYGEKIGLLLNDAPRYNQLCAACPEVREQFYNPDNSLTEAIAKVVDAHNVHGGR
jgi:glycogen synthase